MLTCRLVNLSINNQLLWSLGWHRCSFQPLFGPYQISEKTTNCGWPDSGGIFDFVWLHVDFQFDSSCSIKNFWKSWQHQIHWKQLQYCLHLLNWFFISSFAFPTVSILLTNQAFPKAAGLTRGTSYRVDLGWSISYSTCWGFSKKTSYSIGHCRLFWKNRIGERLRKFWISPESDDLSSLGIAAI